MKWLLATLIMLNTGCATMSNRTKTIVTAVGVGLVAGTIAANMAPKDENPMAHAAVWGGAATAGTAVAGLFLFDEQARSKEFERKLVVAESELAIFRGESSTDQQVIYDSDSALGRELPSEYRSLVRPGKWSLYRTNQWISQGENVLVHQDKILKIEPPQFQPPGAEMPPIANQKEGEKRE